MSALVSAAGAATLRHCARRALPKSLAAHAMAAARTVHSKPCEAPARGGRGAKQQAMGNGAGLFLMGGVAAGAATIAAATLAVEQEDRNPALTAEAYSIPIGRAFPGVVSAAFVWCCGEGGVLGAGEYLVRLFFQFFILSFFVLVSCCVF